MNNTILKLLSKSEEQLQMLVVEIEDPIKLSETAINILNFAF